MRDEPLDGYRDVASVSIPARADEMLQIMDAISATLPTTRDALVRWSADGSRMIIAVPEEGDDE